MPTPHLTAREGEFASSVLLPGDPLRATYIAERWFAEPRRVNEVRGALGYTGTFQGLPVSVLGTGMGIPSMAIYATELVQAYGARRLVRVGSCGALSQDVGLREVVVAAGACTDSGVNRARYRGLDFAAIPDFWLLRATVDAARSLGIDLHVGNVHTSDLFYERREEVFESMRSMGVLAVDMETAGLYGVAAEQGVRALAVLTVSDHLVSGERSTPKERESTFDAMVEMALAGLVTDGERE